jgi:peptidoglycan hydrolase-like protein with peptidoglycan-binding domain
MVAASTTIMTPTTTELVYVAELPQGALFVGVEGPRSLAVQQQLISLAILPSTAADSKYGPGTAAGVRRFQESQGLIVDGVAGPITLAALASAVTAGSSTTPPTTSD